VLVPVLAPALNGNQRQRPRTPAKLPLATLAPHPLGTRASPATGSQEVSGRWAALPAKSGTAAGGAAWSEPGVLTEGSLTEAGLAADAPAEGVRAGRLLVVCLAAASLDRAGVGQQGTASG
jgi:hypothetical protein